MLMLQELGACLFKGTIAEHFPLQCDWHLWSWTVLYQLTHCSHIAIWTYLREIKLHVGIFQSLFNHSYIGWKKNTSPPSSTNQFSWGYIKKLSNRLEYVELHSMGNRVWKIKFVLFTWSFTNNKALKSNLKRNWSKTDVCVCVASLRAHSHNCSAVQHTAAMHSNTQNTLWCFGTMHLGNTA